MHLQILIKQKNLSTFPILDKSKSSLFQSKETSNSNACKIHSQIPFQIHFTFIEQHHNNLFEVTEINKEHNYSTEAH